ncbi:GAF domain-containing protein, partial [Streptomyces hyaluromycini]
MLPDPQRFLAVAGRRIARAEGADQAVRELYRVTVPDLADGMFVYLGDHLPGRSEPEHLRLDGAPTELGGVMGGTPPPSRPVAPDGALAAVLRCGRARGRGPDDVDEALRELLGTAPRLPQGNRVLLAPLRAPDAVVGVVVFLRRPDREDFVEDDIALADALSAQTALGVREDTLGSGPPAVPKAPDEDRLRYVGAATRRIARGFDTDEIVLGLCRAAVPTYSDAALVYLRDPLPVGDERPNGPAVLRLRRTDRLKGPGAEGLVWPAETVDDEQDDLDASDWSEVVPGGALAEVLRGVRPVFADTPPT